MEFNEKLVSKVINNIQLPKKFGLILYSELMPDVNDDPPAHYADFVTAVKEIEPTAYVTHGVSKICIASPKFDGVVIKIPFNGFFLPYAKSGPGDDDPTGSSWCSFCCAFGSLKNDYCMTELEKYKKLKEKELEMFVAATQVYDVIDGRNIYIQEETQSLREYYNPNRNIPHPQSFLNKIEKITKKYHSSLRPTWLADCTIAYGQSKVEEFLKFCYNHDRDITADCHIDNYGYRRDDTPAIFDYSNFGD